MSLSLFVGTTVGMDEKLYFDYRTDFRTIEFFTELYLCYIGRRKIKASERGTCIKGLFWPPLEPKIES